MAPFIPEGGTLASIFTSTSLDRLIPLFGSLDKALPCKFAVKPVCDRGTTADCKTPIDSASAGK